MVIAGVIIIIVATLMYLFPAFFLKLKTPNAKSTSNLEKAVRVWSVICSILGIALVFIGYLS